MVQIKNIHEKLLESIQVLLIDTRVDLPYYGEFNLHVNFHEDDKVGTCGVNVGTKGMNFFYSPTFLANLSQREVNFIVLHEDFHLLFNHPRRTITGQYDHKMSNIVQDMIINHIIWQDITHSFVEIPKSKDGKNMALFVPKEYEGKLIFEELYEWMREEKDKFDKKNKPKECKSCKGTGEKQEKSQGKGEKDKDSKGEGESGEGESGEGESGEGKGESCPDCSGTGNEDGKDSSGKPSYGPYGKDPSDNKKSLDTWSIDQIFQDMENNNGEYLDKHITDEVPEEMREGIVREVMDRLQARGLTAGNIETTLNKLRKKRKDYLKEIKRAVSNMIFGTQKVKTIVKPNRRGIPGLKGHRKVKTEINVILDTSGSMGGASTFEKVLSYVYRNDIEINFIESDTQIKWVEKIKSAKGLESIPIKGLGGTVMQTGIDYVCEHFNYANTVLLTDGYTDTLDCSRLKGRLLIISVGVKCPIGKTNNKVKQIVLDVSTN